MKQKLVALEPQLPAEQLEMLSTQKGFLKIVTEIDDFLQRAKGEESEAAKALEVLDDMRWKFSDMMDIYSISPEEFPRLQLILAKNSGVLARNFNQIKQHIAQYREKPTNCYEFIYSHCSVITEQYIKIAIEGLYRGLVSQVIPSLPSLQAKDALTFSMIRLSDFFRGILKAKICWEEVLSLLAITEKALSSLALEEGNPYPEGTYIILIAGLFSNLNNIPLLDFSSQQAITDLMRAQLFILQRAIAPINKRPTLQQTEFSMMVNFPHHLLPAYLTFSGFFNTCPKSQDFLRKIENIKKILSKMYGFYAQFPNDFSGLSDTFLEDARTLKQRCQNSLFENRSLQRELDMFYGQMVRRCFQMNICQIYNTHVDLGDNSINSERNSESSWQDALASIIGTIAEIQKKIGYSEKTEVSLAERFSTLEPLLLWEENPVPAAIAVAQRCIIALALLFTEEAPEIKRLSSKSFEKIMGTVIKLQELLGSMLENSLSESKIYTPERMQILFKQIQPKQASALTTTVNPTPSEDFKVPYHLTAGTIFNLFSFFAPQGTVRNLAEDLRKVAHSYGLICKNVAGDGNCLFTAVAVYVKYRYPESYQTYSLTSLADDVRKRMTKYLSDHKDDYQDFVANQNFDIYLKNMSKSGTWGDYISLHVLAIILKMSIVVISSDGSKPVVLKNPNANEKDLICLGYEVPIHYQLLLPKEGDDLPPKVNELIEHTEFMNVYFKKSSSEEAVSVSLQ